MMQNLKINPQPGEKLDCSAWPEHKIKPPLENVVTLFNVASYQYCLGSFQLICMHIANNKIYFNREIYYIIVSFVFDVNSCISMYF